MRKKDAETIRSMLLQRRRLLFNEVAHTEADLSALDAAAEIELEEAAQDEQMRRLLARLDRRAKTEVEEIDGALARLASGRYGTCVTCAEPITSARLQALPATPLCIACATVAERPESLEATVELGEPASAPPRADLPAEYALLSDRELRDTVREQLVADDRLDLDELRIVCRHGVVYLDGEVPSQAEHQILLHTITDVMGLAAVVDRIRVGETQRVREPSSAGESPSAQRSRWEDLPVTEDVVEATDADFDAPSKPPSDGE